MGFLKWLLQGLLELWTLAVGWLSPVVQRFFLAFGIPIDAVAAQFIASLLLLGLVAWLFRKVSWGKPKMFEQQKITLKTEKSPLSVVVGEISCIGLAGVIVSRSWRRRGGGGCRLRAAVMQVWFERRLTGEA